MNRGSLPVLNPVTAALSDAVDRLHGAIDEVAQAIAAKHGDRLKCGRGCSGCCVDGLTVFEVEAHAIAQHHPEVLAQAPHEEGACAFLDAAGGCRIYDARPYVCRTQGLPLRWLDDDGLELRDVCTLNLVGESLEALPSDACWPIGPVEMRLATLQEKAPADEAGGLRRVALRALFTAR